MIYINIKDGGWKGVPCHLLCLLENRKVMEKLTCLADGRVDGKTEENS